MLLGKKHNDEPLRALRPYIQDQMNTWQIVNVRVKKDSDLSNDDMLKQVMEAYKAHEGVLYPLTERQALCIVRLGAVENFAEIKMKLEKMMPDHSCAVSARRMSMDGFNKICQDIKQPQNDDAQNMFLEREKRTENVLMVADDDLFVRKGMQTLLDPYGTVTEAEKGDEIISQYIKTNPDMLLLDIHMPDINGLDIIEKIMEIDNDAYIIVFSADSVVDNVMTAMEKGAVGFISKPPCKDKLCSYLSRCMTYK